MFSLRLCFLSFSYRVNSSLRMRPRNKQSRSRINRAYNSNGTPLRRTRRRAAARSPAGPSHIAQGGGRPPRTGGGGASPPFVDDALRESIGLLRRVRLRLAQLLGNPSISSEVLVHVVPRLTDREFLDKFLNTPDHQLALLLH